MESTTAESSATPARPAALPILPLAAGLVAAAVGSLIWGGVYVSVGAMWIPPLLIGLLVGLAIRLTARANSPRWLAICAVVLTVLSCFAGYVWTYLALIPWIDRTTGDPVQPAFADAFRRFLNDLFAILLIAIGAYLAFTVSRRSASAA